MKYLRSASTSGTACSTAHPPAEYPDWIRAYPSFTKTGSSGGNGFCFFKVWPARGLIRAVAIDHQALIPVRWDIDAVFGSLQFAELGPGMAGYRQCRQKGQDCEKF